MAKPGKHAPPEVMSAPAITIVTMAIILVASTGWLDTMSESARFMTDRLRLD